MPQRECVMPRLYPWRLFKPDQQTQSPTNQRALFHFLRILCFTWHIADLSHSVDRRQSGKFHTLLPVMDCTCHHEDN